MLCEANERVRAKLWKYGVLDRLLAGDYAERLSEQLAKAVKPAATQAMAGGAEQPAQP
jgi:SulP family sulfate permease